MSVGFAVGLRALLAARTVMDIIGHNLANQNTRGYSRQVAILKSSRPVTGSRMIQFGTGVDLTDIYSVVNESLLARIRAEVSQASQYEAESSLMDQVESLLGDLTENGIASKLQALFNSSTEAGSAPEDTVLRQNFLSSASDLALAFRLKVSGLDQMRSTSLLESHTIITSANQLLGDVASLNRRIRTQEVVGTRANDLKDQRSVALEQLSELIGATAMQLPDGTMNVTVQGVTLVSGASATLLETQVAFHGGVRVMTMGGAVEVKSPSGQLAGILNMIERYLPGRVSDLDQMARNLILEMNRVHARGVPATGPFTQLTSSYSVKTAPGTDPRSATLENAGLPFDLQSGTFSIAVSNLARGDVQRFDIPVDPSNDSVQDLLDSINAVPQLNAFLDGVGKLHIKANSGYGFDFSQRLDTLPVEGGTFGDGAATIVGENFPANLTNGAQLTVAVDGGAPQTITFNAADFVNINAATADEVADVFNAQAVGMTASVVDGRLVLQSNASGSASSLAVVDGASSPAAAMNLPLAGFGTDTPVQVTITGITDSDAPHQFTFKAKGDGDIGISPGLEVEVYDNGTLLTTLQVGDGYEPGSPIEVIDGVYIEFSPGTIQGSANQFFDLSTPGDTDTADVLAAFGLNALFEGSDATTIRVNPLLESNPHLVAGASFGGSGDGGNFLAMAEVASSPLAGLGNASITSFYNAFAAEIGTSAAGAAASLQSSSLVLLTLQTQRAAESGVNQDEELLNLEKFQDAYEAAAKYLSVLSELDDVLLQL
ncbi:MAG: flagellar hook-associated protein FlgK [Planctomycetota bacterium]